MRKILLVDDDRDLAAITSDMLISYGYDTTLVENCDEAYEVLTNTQFALVILDINLPDGTGFEVCRELRQVSKVPIIFASARTSEDDKITGLNMGGDDYLAKPYSLKELLARVNALMRRTYGAEPEEKIYTFGAVKVDIGTRSVWRDGKEVRLALKEFDVLACLCRHAGQTVSKEELLHEVWGAFSEAEGTTVAVHIRWLREKLEENPAEPIYIKTVWGVGYQLILEGKKK
jgi:DNA-binding response OmpR family regulator